MSENLSGYDAWKSRLPEDERDAYTPQGECEVCAEDDEQPPFDVLLCADCGLCAKHCHGHSDDELAADQGLDDDIDY